jgi:hypothetical protein
MPVATVARNTERFELTTCEGAYIIVRRMSFGEKLTRQDEMLKMRTSGDKESRIEFDMMNKKTALSDFGNLVIEHNLTDENDRLLNFKNQQDVLSLDPRVGDEISQCIDSINSFEETQDTKN